MIVGEGCMIVGQGGVFVKSAVAPHGEHTAVVDVDHGRKQHARLLEDLMALVEVEEQQI